MATAKRTTAPRMTAARRARRIALALLVASGLILAWFWAPLNAYARTGASYGARVACACRYIAGRALADCRRDFEPGMAWVVLSEDSDEKTVTATFLPLDSQSARYREGWGCVLEDWAA